MEKKIVIVHPSFTSAHRRAITDLAGEHGYEVRFFETNREAYEEIRDAEAALGFGADLVSHGEQLKWFCTASAGVDIYLQPGVLPNREMILSNSTGAFGVTLAEHTLMMTLELLRRQLTFNRIAARHDWDRTPLFRSIKDASVTILGTGDLGYEIAKRVRGFEPKRIIGVNARGVNPAPELFDRILRQEQAEEILSETDILLMCLPGTPKTFHFMDARRISMLPVHAVLVNVGRGSAVDTAALAKALEEDRLAAAGLDVFETEPLAKEDPLWETKNLLITPHVAGNMTLGYTVDRCAALYLEDLENYLNGRPLLRRVDPERGY